jgi:hypothetical protein
MNLGAASGYFYWLSSFSTLSSRIDPIKLIGSVNGISLSHEKNVIKASPIIRSRGTKLSAPSEVKKEIKLH